MHIEIIEGGVSPLKAKRQASRGGKEAGRATAKKGGYLKGRGGYKKSSGTQGTGVNRGGYNVHTRFKPRAKPEGPKGGGGGTTKDAPQKPYSFDKDGDIVINNYIDGKGGTQSQSQTQTQTQPNNVEKENKEILKSGEQYRTTEGTTTSKRKSKGSFLEVWDANENNFQDKWKTQGGFDAWKIQAQKEIDEGYYSETRTVDGKKQKRTWTQKNDEPKVWTEWEDV